MARAGDLEVTVEMLPEGKVVVHVDGDLDLATSPEFEEALASADSAGRTVVDLTGCTFLDSSAVRVLVAAARATESARGKIALVASDPGILRVLEIAAVDTMLPVHESLETAL